MADNSWSDNPRLKNIDPRKLSILMDLVNDADGKPMDKLVPLLMNTQKKLQKQNLNFSQDETDLMLEILTKNMNAKEKTQFEMIKKMMAQNKRKK